ncbi:hypothetical protein D3C80_2047320 [compost metagenome]
MMITQSIERGPLRDPHTGVEARHGHCACAKVGDMGFRRIAHMQQMQLGVALQGQRTRAVDDLLVQVLASAVAIEIDRCSDLPG